MADTTPYARTNAVSFAAATRRVRNRGLPFKVRYQALRWCIERHTWVTGRSFNETFQRLGHHLGYDRQLTETQLLDSLRIIEVERERAKETHHTYARRRKAEKRRGIRSPKKGDGTPRLPDHELLLPSINPSPARKRERGT